MNIVDIIEKKRRKETLNFDEIKFAIEGFINGDIPDYQMSALLMAITINGMTKEETFNLTEVMINSGDVISFEDVPGAVVDKHSTGGVGDKVTLVLAPLLASLGIKIAKLSGRGLGFTGGTIDKLESIEGFDVNLSIEQIKAQVNDINIAIAGHTGNIDPADKKIYALRDVTATVESIPLIASSIMSKKIAMGSDMIVIDLKVGAGALMKDLDSARELANLMIEIGKKYNKPTVCVLSSMNEPLGNAVGNSLEVLESIKTLRGNGPSDLLELVMLLACIVIMPIKKVDVDEARTMVFNELNNNKAYKKFLEFVKYQGGNLNKIKISDKVISIRSDKSGYVNGIDALKIGEISVNLGAGRIKKEDSIDYTVGLVLSKKVGDRVEVNDELAKVYVGKKDISINEVKNCFLIEDELIIKEPLVYEIIK
jgi:pyrimidine-nucleoside phosphorylase